MRDLWAAWQANAAARRVLDDLHAGQRRVVYARDGAGMLAMLVCLLSPRRFGKTSAFLMLAVATCLRKRRARCAVLYQLRADAVDIAWPLMEELNERYQLGCEMLSGSLTMRFPNGSIIKCFGADDPKKHRRFRGSQWDLFLIDEAQDWYSSVEKLVRAVQPGCARRHGRIFIMGTPPELPEGYFDEVCAGKHPQWVLVTGSSFENPHTAPELSAQLDVYRRVNPEIDQAPWVRREYYGERVTDTRKNVCHVDPLLNYLRPEDVLWAVDEEGRWQGHPGDRNQLIVDWGERGAAYVLQTYNPDMHPWLIYLDAERLTGMRIGDHAEHIQRYIDRWDCEVVADPGGISSTIVGELEDVYNIPVQRAKKDNRLAQIQLINSDLSLGLIKIFNLRDPHKPEASPIAEQWRSLVWVTDPRTRERSEGRPRDIHDGCLYGRRFAAPHMHGDPREAEPAPGTPEYAAREARDIRSRAERRVRERLERGRRQRPVALMGRR